MPKPQTEYLHITCLDRAYLAPIKTMGPIVRPLKVEKKAVIRLVMSGAHVAVYNLQTKESTMLTMQNIKSLEGSTVTASPRNNISLNKNTDKASEVPVETPAPVIEQPEEKAASETSDSMDGDKYALEFNPDGTVNETHIPWGSFSKAERKKLRARINAANEAAKAQLPESI